MPTCDEFTQFYELCARLGITVSEAQAAYHRLKIERGNDAPEPTLKEIGAFLIEYMEWRRDCKLRAAGELVVTKRLTGKGERALMIMQNARI